jgi:hypothetical protein
VAFEDKGVVVSAHNSPDPHQTAYALFSGVRVPQVLSLFNQAECVHTTSVAFSLF